MDASQTQPNKILTRMLDRLHAALASGPLLSCRPHSSRQRLDLTQLALPEQIIPALLSERRSIRLALPEARETDDKDAGQAILGKLRTIAEDAKTYEQDTGVHALFVGYPILHLPPNAGIESGFSNKRVLAPVAFIPVQLALKLTRPTSITLERIADGSDLVVPNAALLSWVQQATGQQLFSDDEGIEPWQEINALVAAVCRALEIDAPAPLGAETPLVATPRSDSEDAKRPSVQSSAVLGLFPVSNQGLLRDMQALASGEPVTGPIQSFLTSSTELGLSGEARATQDDIASERCASAADPCQLRAVRLARKATGLVVHGPPGTGKSQTITNIIADHLAAGERVLFVCDKRTALDVVHYRLDHLGLGQLCAVVHDTRRDPKELYRSIHEQLDTLPDAKTDAGCGSSLEGADRELRKLHAELAEYMSAIMDCPASDAESLHALVGAWLAIDVPPELPAELDSTALAELEALERDSRELLDRGRKAGYADNPWTNALGLPLRDYLAKPEKHWRTMVRAIEFSAKQLDATTGSELLPFDPNTDVREQAAARVTLAGLFEEALQRACSDALADWAGRDPAEVARAATDLEALAPAIALLDEPLDRELLPVVASAEPEFAELTLSLGKLASYLEIARKWNSFLYVQRRREVLPTVQRFGLALSADNAARVQTFLDGLRARRLVRDWYGSAETDEALKKATGDRALIVRILTTVPADTAVATLLRDPDRHRELIAALRASEPRAQALFAIQGLLQQTELLDASFRSRCFASACAHQPVHPEITALEAAQDTVEDLLRIRDRLDTLSDETRAFHLALLDQSAGAELGWSALRKAALYGEIARRLADSPVLSRMDADRIRATYARYRTIEERRRELTRDVVLHRWTDLQRRRLLATTGSRLNTAGAEVRRRLVTRGARAMRLRQVIAAGVSIDGGDPLFDLRPVWMASPEAAAQILPRTASFDVVVFDEASQCRLEEALPVLTRAKRVVIAGDPKQLPPTRFFELGATQSQAEFDADTEQQLFEEQQAEVEDLLSAALNLSIEQSYLDVHYRSQNADLIQFSNQSFYDSRLQPIPGHPGKQPELPPVRLVHAGGTYDKRVNPKEAQEVVRIVRDLLSTSPPPSIGVACFNLSQRDAIVDALDRAAAEDADFGERLATARVRRGEASFEGLFVKNLENVQGDERDHIILSTTYGPDPSGRFFRRFGPLGQAGGGRRLNVLVTRARDAVHVVTSIPGEVYRSLPALERGRRPNGAWLLFSYLNYAETLAARYATEAARDQTDAITPACRVHPTETPSALACAIGNTLAKEHAVSSEVHWGNDGFSVDLAVAAPSGALGVLCDATRFDKAPDRVQWDIFRTEILEAQGWNFIRLWTPQLVRDPARAIAGIAAQASRGDHSQFQ